MVCGGFWLGSYLPSPRSSVSSNPDILGSTSHTNRNSSLAGATRLSAPVTTRHMIYPYSVVPGGVASVAELQAAIHHDRVVAQHYTGFDFKKARMIELRHARLAYLSYRIGEKIFWTRRLIALRAGEKLITDGKILARARCGNRVSTLPQIIVAPAEPTVEEFDNPIIEGGSVAQLAFPGSFESALLTRTAPFSFEPQNPAGPVLGPTSLGGPPGFFSPPLPGTCEPARKPQPKPGAAFTPDSDELKKKKKSPCSPKPPVVPEPGTMLLVATGISGIYLRYRKKANSSSSPPTS